MKMFPIQGDWDRALHKDIPGFSIPWAIIQEHSEQVEKNHCGQTVTRIAERGGLGIGEALLALQDKPLRPWPPGTVTEHREQLRVMVEEWSKTHHEN